MIISDPHTQQSAAAIDFGVGDFHDFFKDSKGKRIGTHGLAHFHEHMVYLGTKDYPGRDAVDKQLTKYHGGADADTSDENTNFHLWVQNDGLKGALKIFASLFTNPLFQQDKIEMEMHQVNSEYLLQKPKEGERQFEMVKISAKPGHPYHDFDVGAIETLNVTGIRNMLVEFHKKYFSSKVAKFVLYTHHSLDKGQKLVEETFSGIPHHDMKYPEVSPEAFGPKQLKKNYIVMSVNYKDTLSISFPLPSDTYFHMRVPAIDWITNLIEYKGPGGLYDVLLRSGLASFLSTEETCRDRTVEVYSVIVNLTPKGLWETPKVVGWILDYIKLMRKEALEEWRFEEYRDLDGVAWKYYRRPDDLSKFVRDVAEQMHFKEVEDMLYPNFRAPPERYIFNKKFLKRILESMVGDNMISYLFTKHHNFTQYENKMERDPWFDIEYMKSDIEKSHLKKWKNSKGSKELSLPPKNTWKMDHTQETKVKFKAGACGIKYMPKTGKITAIKRDHAAAEKGVEVGWKIKSISGEKFSQETMKKYNKKEREIVFTHEVLPFERPRGYDDNTPQVVVGSDYGEPVFTGYFSYETRKNMPRVWVSIRWKNPNLKTNAENMALTKLFQRVTNYQFNLGYGQAMDGGYHFESGIHRSAIEYKFFGYHLHMRRFVRGFITDCFNTTISPKAFNSLRINLRDSIRNDVMNVARYQAWHHFLHAVGDRKVSLEDQIAILNGITQKKYENFADYLSTNVQTLFFVYGNADERFVKDIGDSIDDNIQSNYVDAINDTHTSHKQIPKGLSVAQYTNKNSHDDNDSITVLWQISVGESNSQYYWTMTMMDILVDILKEAAFDELRTRQNLGYTCSTRLENFGFIAYLRLDIEGPDHDASQMLDVIMKFVGNFGKTVKAIDDKKWDKMLRAQRSRYRKKEKTLQQTHDSLWMGLKYTNENVLIP